MTKILEQLEEKALAATGGVWFYDSYARIMSTVSKEHPLDDSMPDEPGTAEIAYLPRAPSETHGGDARNHPATIANAKYLAAANPATILTLIECLRLARGGLQEIVALKPYDLLTALVAYNYASDALAAIDAKLGGG